MVEWNSKTEAKKGYDWLKAMKTGKVFGIDNETHQKSSEKLKFDSNGKILLQNEPKMEKEPKAYSDYEKMVKLLMANGNSLKHARTGEIIVGTSSLDRKRPSNSRKAHLKRFPRIKYQTMSNAIETHIVCNLNKKTVSIERHEPLPTNQWKSVWYSKGNRRQ